MLNVVAAMRPAPHHLLQAFPRGTGIVIGEAEQGHVIGVQRGHRVLITTSVRFLHQSAPALPQGVEIAEMRQRPEGEIMRGVQFPGDLGTPAAQHRLGLVKPRDRFAPVSDHQRGDTAREAEQPLDMRMIEVGGDRDRASDEGLGAFAGALAAHGDRRGFEREGACDPIGIAGIQRAAIRASGNPRREAGR